LALAYLTGNGVAKDRQKAMDWGQKAFAVEEQTMPKVVQDPKTKVCYHLESDLRHIAAISPDGKLLWCCETLSVPFKVIHFSLDEKKKDVIDVWSNQGLGSWGAIDIKSGVYRALGED
jgi:hypothetical protein